MLPHNGKKETNKRKVALYEEALDSLREIDGELTAEKVAEIYKLDCLECHFHRPPNARSQNCRDNPFCINRLGLELFEKELKKYAQSTENVKREMSRRVLEEQPCGLTNPGNYCYLNSFIQVWFNVPEFRQIVFDWRPSPDYVRPEGPAMDVEQVMNALQLLFFTLQTTPFMETDASKHLTASLRLDDEQQDTQEFALMLFNALDRNLQGHPNGSDIARRMNEIYRGEFEQRVWCKCGRENISRTPFVTVQLQVAGSNSIHDALERHSEVDAMCDYKCPACGEIETTSKQITFIALPPVLMLHLSRYVYEGANGRKKLKNPITYPRELKASELIPNASQDEVYELFAVMIHEGENIHCGHYLDYIKHPVSKKWFKYNDENVTEVKAPGHEASSKPAIRATFDTKHCYGLIYRRKCPIKEIVMPPESITEPWKRSLEGKFAGETKNTVEVVEERQAMIQKRYDNLKNTFDNLQTHADKLKRPKDTCFLPTSLLVNILKAEADHASAAINNDSTPKKNSDEEEEPNRKKRRCRLTKEECNFEEPRIAEAIGNHSLRLCAHGKMLIGDVLYGEVKAVNKAGAAALLKEYAIVAKRETDGRVSPLITGEDLCIDCITQLRMEAQFTDKLKSACSLANKILKDKTRCSVKGTAKPPTDFYVAKKCLTNFRNLAMQQHEYDLEHAKTTSKIVFASSTVAQPKVFSPLANGCDDTPESAKRRGRRRLYAMVPPTNESNGVVDKTEIADNEKKENGGSKSEQGSREHSTDSHQSIKSDSLSSAAIEFNSELRCPHGRLNICEYRHRVSPEELEILSNYFPASYKVLCSDPICNECEKDDKDALLEKDNTVSTLRNLNRELGDVIRNIERRLSLPAKSPAAFGRGICSAFIVKLKTAFRSPRSASIPQPCQDCVMCVHNLPGRPLASDSSSLSRELPCIVPLTESEWDTIFKAFAQFTEDPFIPIIVNEDRTILDFCAPCFEEFMLSRNMEKYLYEDQPIFIRKCEDITNIKPTNVNGPAGKSTRRGHNAGLIKVKMSSTDTVFTLKTKLYSVTGQSPNDQLLYKDDDLLENGVTLGEAEIEANNENSPLILITQAVELNPLSEEPMRPERGFVDTALAY